MPTVSDLKDQARAYEQKGQIRKALAIYQHILLHLEDKPAVVKVLPLYVKVGDLLLKQNQRAAAVESYEKAANHYAALGSARRVGALCTKIVRADAQRSDVHVHFTRKLIDAGHIVPARDVLADYAEVVGLDKAAETLDDLAGRPDDEVQPMLERLLQSVGQGERTSAERTAERVSTQLQRVTDDVAGTLVGVSTVELAAEGSEQVEEKTELTPPLIDLGFSRSPIVSAKTPAVQPPAERRETLAGPMQSFDDTPVEPVSEVSHEAASEDRVAPAAPEREAEAQVRPVTTRPATPYQRPMPLPPSQTKPTKSRFSSALIGFVIGAVSGAGAVWVIAVPRGDAAAPSRTIDSAVTQRLPALEAAVDSTPTLAQAADTQPDQSDSASDLQESAPGDDPSAPIVSPTQVEPAIAADSGLADPQLSQPTGPIVVEGMAIRSVTGIEYRGQAGFRVEHPLGNGKTLTVESFPLDTNATSGGSIGRVVVNLTPPDTLVGILRLERHMVYTSAVIPEDSLRVLMSRLVERGPIN